MASISKKINTSELDFDQIKSNLITFLQGQSEFQDYDFTGSSLNILLDILAYNTHYTSLYQNMAINEAFLDSASKRNNIVSRAKDLGYIPKSVSSAKAVIDLRVTSPTTTPSVLTLPKFTPFSSIIDNIQYNFYTLEETSTVLVGSEYLFENIEIKEGTPLTYNIVVDSNSKFIIPNQNVDLSTLKISVKETSASIEKTPYLRSETILELNANSLVYFVKEIEDELQEIEFGDGIIGKALENGNVVLMEYFVSNKTAANFAKTFTYQGGSLLGGIITVTTKQVASGGSNIENVESIRFNAPKYYGSQNRAVTTEDFKAIIQSLVPNIASVNVWGGEDNDPPIYGKVFICIKPVSSPFLTSDQKTQIISEIIKSKKVLSVIPEIKDPKLINVEINCSVYFNPSITTRTASDIKILIEQVIQDYNTNYLEKFNSGFRNSQLSRMIDSSDPGIISSIATIKLHVPFIPVYNTNSNYVINLGNPIANNISEQNILSTAFLVSGSADSHYIEDDGLGILKLFKISTSGIKTVINNSFGTVDYTKGKITIPVLNIASVIGNPEFIIRPESYDVISVRDQIVQIPDDLIYVTSIVDTISLGNAQGGTNYIFSSSRS